VGRRRVLALAPCVRQRLGAPYEAGPKAVGDHGLQLVKCLLEAYPESVRETTPQGNVALHLAFQSDHGENHSVMASSDVVKCLLGAWPEALQVQGCEDMLPLHCAIANAETPLDVVRSLVEMHPDAVHAKT
jgi:ankyrin repeat protein